MDWATPEKLVKAGKHMGITSKGVSIEWMDQAMFEQAAAVLFQEHQLIQVQIYQE